MTLQGNLHVTLLVSTQETTFFSILLIAHIMPNNRVSLPKIKQKLLLIVSLLSPTLLFPCHHHILDNPGSQRAREIFTLLQLELCRFLAVIFHLIGSQILCGLPREKLASSSYQDSMSIMSFKSLLRQLPKFFCLEELMKNTNA